MKGKNSIKIGDRVIGEGQPTFIVAEVSGNHNQSFDRAVEIIKAAADAGADAIKLQTYTPDTMTIDSDKEWFLVGGEKNPDLWKNKTLYDLYGTAYTPWEWQPKLKKIANDLGLILFSTPFDATAVDFLEDMKVPCYKIASYEAMDIPLLKKIASTKKPVILSAGYYSKEDVGLSISTLRENGASDIAVLHCVTSYSDNPIPEEMNLRTIEDIKKRFGVVGGFSDNNAGIEFPIASVLLGASIVEKHITLSRSDGGPDAKFSIEPKELELMIKAIRRAERAMGGVHYGPRSKAEEENKKQFCRSLFVVKDMKQGEKFTQDNVRVIRPGMGLPPRFLEEILGKTAVKDIERGTPLAQDLIS